MQDSKEAKGCSGSPRPARTAEAAGRAREATGRTPTRAMRSGEKCAVTAARPSFESGRRNPRSLPLSHRTRGSLVRPAGAAWEKVLAARTAGPTACRRCLTLRASVEFSSNDRCLCTHPLRALLRAMQYLFYRYCMGFRQVWRWSFFGLASGLPGALSESLQVRGVGYPTRGQL